MVRIFAAEDGVAGLQYRRALPRVEGRALSCAWHPAAPGMLVAGYGDGCMRVWNVPQGIEVLRMTVGAWSLQVSGWLAFNFGHRCCWVLGRLCLGRIMLDIR